MVIGLDFDNTLVDHRTSIRMAAVDAGWISEDFPADKTRIRDFLRVQRGNDAWTELQGLAYGPGIRHARLFPGVRDFLERCRSRGLEVHVVSHKSERSAIGNFELRGPALEFLACQNLTTGPVPLLEVGRIHFASTRPDKARRVASLGCTHFLDDLPETFEEPEFPDIARFLFHPIPDGLAPNRLWTVVGHWDEFSARVLS